MELKLPYKWIKEYLNTNLSVSEFAKTVSLHGPSIEKWRFEEEIQDDSLEIEVTTNRIDSASVIGLAREASAILKSEFTYNSPEINLTQSKNLPLKVEILNTTKCRRFEAIVIDNIKVGDSPEWLKRRLESCGIKSINNIVDITNYVLLEHGQPMHAYDYNKLAGKIIKIRDAGKDEEVLTLGANASLKLSSDDLVITDENSTICIAGVKGGEKSGIDKNTTTIVLEAANFEPTSIRKTARKYDLITDASKLFEKDLSPVQTHDAMLRAIELVLEISGGEIASDLIDVNTFKYQPTKIKYDLRLSERILGVNVSKEETSDILSSLGFTVSEDGEFLLVEVPYYRANDVEFDYDLTEEIARIYGYHKIPSILPASEIPVVKTPSIIKNEDKVREILAYNGFTEAFTYSLISDKLLSVSNTNPVDVIELLNPLSSDFKYMRRELGSSLLNVAGENEMLREELKLFEISNVYLKVSVDDLPSEESRLVVLNSSKNYKTGFYKVKGIWEVILQTFGVDLKELSYKSEDVNEPFYNGRSANIYYKDELLGSIGQASKLASKTLGLKKDTIILEVNFVRLSKIFDNSIKSFIPIPRFPQVVRDLAFTLDKNIEWHDISEVVTRIDPLIKEVNLFDSFEDIKLLGKDKRSLAFHIAFESNERTLQSEEIDVILSKIQQLVSEKFGATIRE